MNEEKYNIAYQRRKDKYEAYAARKVKSLLDYQLQKFIKRIQQYGLETARNYVDADFQANELFVTIKGIYLQVGKKEATFVDKFISDQVKRKAQSIDIDFFSLMWERLITVFAQNPDTAVKITRVNDYTKQLVRNAIEEVMPLGLGSALQARAIREKVSQFNKTRSLLIARTETTTIANYASYQAAINSGANLVKVWLATGDGRTRDWHITANGQTVGIKEAYTVNDMKMEYPGDPRGGASNVCNCRCTQYYRVK